MIHKLAIFSVMILSATCTILHQPLPLIIGIAQPQQIILQPTDNPNYNFAYEVNDYQTGDIKNQRESRRGDTVVGQYSLIQPDGIRRIVDYRADDNTGFQATVNNEGRPAENTGRNANANENANEGTERPTRIQAVPVQIPSAAPPTVAISRTSIVHTIPNIPSNPWA